METLKLTYTYNEISHSDSPERKYAHAASPRREIYRTPLGNLTTRYTYHSLDYRHLVIFSHRATYLSTERRPVTPSTFSPATKCCAHV